MGVGIPDPDSPTVPLLFALSNVDVSDMHKAGKLPEHASQELIESVSKEKSHLMPGFVYSLLLTHMGGELQVGGYVAASVRHAPVFAPVLPAWCIDGKCVFKHFVVHVQRLYMDGFELLRDARGTLDSGTSCLIVPKVAYDRFTKKHKSGKTNPKFTLTIGGHDFSFSAYNAGKLCVRTLEKVPEHFLIGDVFFREHVVVHDLRNLQAPTVGIATRAQQYEPIKAPPMTETILLQMPNSAAESHTPSLHPAGPLHPAAQEPYLPPRISHGIVGTETIRASQSRDHLQGRRRRNVAPEVAPEVQHSEEVELGGRKLDPKELQKLHGNDLPRMVERIPFITTNGMQYAVEIFVGTPLQKKILVTLDTGSSQLGIFIIPIHSRVYWAVIGCLVTLVFALIYMYWKVSEAGPEIQGYEAVPGNQDGSQEGQQPRGTIWNMGGGANNRGTVGDTSGDKGYQDVEDTAL